MIFLIDAAGIEDHSADLPEGSLLSLAMIPAAVTSCWDGSWVTVELHEAPAELFR
ncbi:hypothetical protein [Corynebacterium sp. A21]|uniref:hypothetical protein n=1 Tax=Corynebacterium sp. A21 TaxID=3457318 RepID=UPI003FD085A1